MYVHDCKRSLYMRYILRHYLFINPSMLDEIKVFLICRDDTLHNVMFLSEFSDVIHVTVVHIHHALRPLKFNNYMS